MKKIWFAIGFLAVLIVALAMHKPSADFQAYKALSAKAQLLEELR